MKIKNFGQFKKIYENSEEIIDDAEFSTAPTIKPGTPTKPATPTKPLTPGIEQPSISPGPKAQQPVNIDQMLEELAMELGAKKTSNKINYNGKLIEFYSEPMSFAINGKINVMVNGTKTQLKTVEEVINYLMDSQAQTQTLTESKKKTKMVKESNKFKGYYIIGYGLSGGFGGIRDYEVIEASSQEEADDYAYERSCEYYENYVGMYGLRDVGQIMEEDDIEDEEEAEEYYREEMESWLEYVAFPYTKEKANELEPFDHFKLSEK